MRKFLISCVISEDKIAAVFQLLVGDASDLRVQEILPDADPVFPPHPFRIHGAGGDSPPLNVAAPGASPVPSNPPDDARMVDVVLSVFSDGKEHHVQEVRRVIAERGFSQTSVSPMMTELRRANRIVVQRRGIYRLQKPSLDAALGDALARAPEGFPSFPAQFKK
jgi:hypothetical protein